MAIILWFLVVMFFITSLIGVIVPFVPDTILLWVGFIITQFFIDSVSLPFSFWMGMIIITVIILGSDFLTNTVLIKKHGGSKWTIIGGMIGVIAGPIFLGPIGILLGPLILVYLISYLEKGDNKSALRCARGALIAFFSSSIIKIFLQLVMIVWFIIKI